MCHWNEMYWATYLSDQTNSLKAIGSKRVLGQNYIIKSILPKRVLGQNWIDITWNNDLRVQLWEV